MKKHPTKEEILEAIENQPKISKVTVLSCLLAVNSKFHYIPKIAVEEIANYTGKNFNRKNIKFRTFSNLRLHCKFCVFFIIKTSNIKTKY